MLRRFAPAAASAASALALLALAGCAGTGTPPPAASPSASTAASPPAATSAAAASILNPLGDNASAADQAAYQQAFTPLADCTWTYLETKLRRTITAVAYTMNAGNNGYCTYPVRIAGGDVPTETLTSQPQHGTVKFLLLSTRVLVGYQATAGYVGPDQFQMIFRRADGIRFPISTQVTVANPAAK